MRVLVVAPSLDRAGGQSVQAARLLEGLGREPSVSAAFLRTDIPLRGVLRPFEDVRYARTLVRFPLYVVALLKRIRRADIVHVFAASYWSFLLNPAPAVVLARLLRKKVVVNYHSGHAPDHLARSRAAVRMLRAADAIVVQSSFLADAFARVGLATTVIPNHLQPGSFRFHVRQPLRPSFLSTRALEPSYDVRTLLRAFAIVQRRRPHAVLRVVGDGSRRADLERLAHELRLRSVTFSGSVDAGSMPAVYDGADILLNASTVDSMPLSLLEAFAAGVVVVSTSAGGIGTLVRDGETGLLVPPGDAVALAAAALRLLEDDRLAARLAAAAREESAKYTWPATGPRWLALYGSLVAARAGQAELPTPSTPRA